MWIPLISAWIDNVFEPENILLIGLLVTMLVTSGHKAVKRSSHTGYGKRTRRKEDMVKLTSKIKTGLDTNKSSHSFPHETKKRSNKVTRLEWLWVDPP